MDKTIHHKPVCINKLSELKKALFVLPDGTVGTYRDLKEFDSRQYFNTGGEDKR